MKSDRLNRWLALLANTAVLVGIVLLIIELNQNRDMMRAQIRNEISRAELEMLTSWSGDRDLADIFVKANSGEELTAVEQFMIDSRSETIFRLWQNIHYQYRQGLYADSEFDASIETFSHILNQQPYLLDAWCRTKTMYSTEFAEHLQSLLPKDAC